MLPRGAGDNSIAPPSRYLDVFMALLDSDADLKKEVFAAWSLPELEGHFGSSGGWYWRIARGIDDRQVKSDRPNKSVSAQRTFDTDLRDPIELAQQQFPGGKEAAIVGPFTEPSPAGCRTGIPFW
jgi:hypothetical protein